MVAGAVQNGGSEWRSYYRIIRTEFPSWSDFLSNQVRDQPARDIEVDDPLEWTGISVFDRPDRAAQLARRYDIGRFLAQVSLGPGDPVIVRPSRGRGHWTLVGGPGVLLRRVDQILPVEQDGR